MRRLRVALAQINSTVGDLEGNRALCLDAARRAADLQADLVAFPELAICGYPPEDLLLRASFIADASAALLALARDAAGLPPLVVGALEFDGVLYNSAAVLHGGRVVGSHRKQRLPNYGVFDEQRYFQPGTTTPRFVIGGVEVAATVCEDIWYPDGPAREAALAGAEVIININASPFHAGKARERERMLATRAVDNHVVIAYVNQVGGQDELVFDGNSLVLDARGELLARGASLREDLVVVDIAVDEVLQVRLHESRLRHGRDVRRSDGRDGREPAPPLHVTAAHEAAHEGARAPLPQTELAAPNVLAETYEALVVGTRDYVRKSGFGDVIVALSGGLDSSLVAAVAVDALGPEHVRGVSLPSRYSSEGSVGDARDLAERLGIELVTMPIEPLHEAALDTLAREFESTREGTAEENLQSRLRGLLVMALSNKFGGLVLTTGNKSEYACGYATLYGDMVGGFAVIKDVPKTLAYDLARHRNSRGVVRSDSAAAAASSDDPVIPQAVIDKPPSAELRPDQLDTDSLPPYEVLDPIIEAYVEDDASFEAIVARGFDPETVGRIIDLIDRNEYKRRQSPPGVKITPRAFGRDRRYPLASRYHGH
ncbi:MAG: NAD+ synthase [Chloroflexi bacterium]|nr:NAD+ synthase [Chloroflexota bacterium]